MQAGSHTKVHGRRLRTPACVPMPVHDLHMSQVAELGIWEGICVKLYQLHETAKLSTLPKGQPRAKLPLRVGS